MPRLLSFAIIAASFVAGVFLPDWVGRLAVPPRPEPSGVALEASPDPEPGRKETGHAPGVAVRAKADGTVEADSSDVITPLNVRDPSALVMTPSRLQLPSCAEAPCDCNKDRLHRYTPKAPRNKELDALRGKTKKKP
jgi:hypothetical protein